MKHSFLTLVAASALLWSCTSQKSSTNAKQDQVNVTLDLVNVNNDKVKVVAKPARITSATITYQVPRIIPGTYAIADYGRYIEDFKAYDKSGKTLSVSKADVNSWKIENATQLDKIEYWVNDTFDVEEENAFGEHSKTIFSPAGTNILAGENFLLNLCGFVGYFDNQKDFKYQVTIDHPNSMVGTTALSDQDPSNTKDLFYIPRYSDVVDNPIMYAKPDVGTFTVNGMEVDLHVYSPRNKQINAAKLLPDLQKMITAQKKFLGDINHTKKYAILVYITSMNKDDARGLGALEHNNSTTATFNDDMKTDELIHVISHEFFHTLTPLNVHSKEIHYFDFNQPKMSQHLWMYEGFTEYFANLFQVKEGLIDEKTFLALMADKETNSKNMFKDDLSFTEMSKNVLEPTMKKQYPNVYEKGALMAMCLDIIIKEKSNGEKGIREVMGELSNIYGPTRPFEDADLIPEFTKITYPEVGDFINKHIVKGEPIDYGMYLAKVGVEKTTIKVPIVVALLIDKKPYFRMDAAKKIYIATQDGENEFIKAIGFQNDDQILELNGSKIDGNDITKVILPMYKLKDGEPYTAKVLRNGQEVNLKGNVKLNYIDGPGYVFKNPAKESLKNKWLK